MRGYKIFLMMMLAAAALSCEKEKGQKGEEEGGKQGGEPPEELFTIWAHLTGSAASDRALVIDTERFLIDEFDEPVHYYQHSFYGRIDIYTPVADFVCKFTDKEIRIPVNAEGNPAEGMWEAPPEGFTREGNEYVGKFSISDGVLTLAGVRYEKVEHAYTTAPYATISTTLEGNAAIIGAEAAVVKIPFSVTPPLPWCTVTAIRDRSMLLAEATITWDESEVSVSIPAGTDAGSGVVSLQAEGANDLNVTINRKIGRLIVPSVTEVTRNYKLEEYSDITFTIINPIGSSEPGVRVDENATDWMSAFYSSEGDNTYKLYYTLGDNDTGASRTGKIYITYPDAPEVAISVTQTFDAVGITFNPSSASVSFLGEGLVIPVTVTNEREACWFDVSSSESWIQDVRIDTQWIEPEEGSGEEFTEEPVASGHYEHTLRCLVVQNESTTPRSGTISIKYTRTYGGAVLATVSYTVNQGGVGPVITLDPEEMTVDFHTNYSATFCYRIDYGSNNEVITTDVDWLHPYSHEWNSDGETKTAKFSILSENQTKEPRVGHIRVTDGSVWKELTVTQTGIQSKIIVDNDVVTFDYNRRYGTSIYYRVLDDSVVWRDIQGSSNVDWMQPVRPYLSTEYHINIEDNNSGADREGILTLSYGSEVSRVKIIQTYTAPEIRIENPNVSTDYTAKSGVFVKCVVAWPRISVEPTYESDADWVQTMAVTNGVQLTFAENKTNITRSAKVTVRYLDDFTATINVTQGIRSWFDVGTGRQFAACNVGATSGEKAGTYAKWADAASKITEGRLPTNQEWYDFARAFTWTWEPRNGVNGCVGRPNNEAYAGIEYFIPAVGYYSTSGTLMYSGSYGYYWTSDNDTSFPQTAWVAVCSDALSRKVDTGYYININNKATFRAVK